MANEPDNLVLVHLREIRVTLAEHSARFDQMEQRFALRFDQLEKGFEDFRALANHTLMLGTSAHLKGQDLERRYEFGEGEQRRLSDRIDDIERRVSDLEDKDDGEA